MQTNDAQPARIEVAIGAVVENMSSLAMEVPPRPTHTPWINASMSDLCVLITLREQSQVLGGHWELPGGKIEPGETPQDALVREMREEVGIDIQPVQPLPAVEHQYEHGLIRLTPYLCRRVRGLPEAIEVEAAQWVQPKDLSRYNFPAASLPVIDALLKELEGACAADSGNTDTMVPDER